LPDLDALHCSAQAPRGERAHPGERCVAFLTGLREGPAPALPPGPSLAPGADRSREEFVRVPVELLIEKPGGLSSFRVLWRPVPRVERPSLSRAERNP
jgi:hypothetical protein